MSKVKEAKEKQGYTPKFILPVCGNCKHFQSDQVPLDWNPKETVEGKLRCGIGGFAVKKRGSCMCFEYKAGLKKNN